MSDAVDQPSEPAYQYSAKHNAEDFHKGSKAFSDFLFCCAGHHNEEGRNKANAYSTGENADEEILPLPAAEELQTDNRQRGNDNYDNAFDTVDSFGNSSREHYISHFYVLLSTVLSTI